MTKKRLSLPALSSVSFKENMHLFLAKCGLYLECRFISQSFYLLCYSIKQNKLQK